MKYVVALLLLVVGTVGLAQSQNTFSISGVEESNVFIPNGEEERLRTKPSEINEFGVNDVLTTPNPSREAVALYRYIQDMFGKKTFSGQQWVQWGIDEMDYIENTTGKIPAIVGFDYINESQNAIENQRAIEHWNNGGIVTIMYHQGAPSIGEGYDNSKEKIDIERIFIEGTPENIDFWGDLERIGDHLQVLEDANVPVLWRPFHELTGNWFWWSKGGPEQFKKLWIAMYDYLVEERELDNLIWVLCYTADPKEGGWFPGSDYVDLAGADTYDDSNDSHLDMYNRVLAAVDGNNYPIVFHETENPPNPQECIVDGAMWSWWMIWHTNWLTDLDQTYVKEVYESDLILSFDDLPDIVDTYGWEDTCVPASITASIEIGDGSSVVNNMIGVQDGEGLVTLNVETEDDGIWNWSGYDTTNDADFSATSQEITIDGVGTVTAQFTNTCGAVSTQTFHVTNGNIINIPLAIPSDIVKNEISVYPSPAFGILNVELSQSNANGTIVKLFDMNGTLISQKVSMDKSFSFDVSTFRSGIYSLVASNEEFSSVYKFIKK